jgi:glyoxylase-like metal-dependent hydrolase (beta-lactamase superfamily II)
MKTLTDYNNGIFAIDAHYVRPLLAAVHMIESTGRVAFVDTATFTIMPHALAALSTRGLTAKSVDYVILTHIHLDHAGGAGAMMAAFPNAKLVVHPRGARHMADPSKLMAGVEAVYGRERARAMYGELIPIATDRIIEAHDNTLIRLGTRELLCIDTPGHAKHQIAIIDRQTSGIFTGDTFGISYRECDVSGRPFLFPSTTPSQFNPADMRASITRMIGFEPEAMYLTHYSRIAPPRVLAEDVLRRMDECVRIAKTGTADADRIEKDMAAYLLSEARVHGCTLSDQVLLELWAMDLELNAKGLAVWLDTVA